MGLDVYALVNLRPVDDETYNSIYLCNDVTLKRRGEGTPEGIYEGEGVAGFRAGSYSSYNDWRDRLCQFVHGVPAKKFWQMPVADSDAPFAELINFTDCDGYLGNSVCKKLLKDFEEQGERLRFFPEIKRWETMFRAAVEGGGVVVFS